MIKKERIDETNIIRGIACLAVVLVHITAGPVTSLREGSIHSIIFTLLNRGAKFTTPTFLFLSGLTLFYSYEERDFKYEIDKIKDEKIDIAFFPVDPRLEEFSHLGGEHFIKTMSPKLFIPMHFGDSFSVCKDFADKVQNSKSEIAVLTKPCDEVVYY